MKTISVLGIDLAKNVFQLYGVNERSQAVMDKKISRQKLVEFVSNLKPCVIAMEACGSAHYWAREFKKMGHDAKLIAPQFVKPYVKTNKSDAADARAIVEAATRPHMRFVPIKQTRHHDMQSWLRVRDRFVRSRTAVLNECHGLLAEYGIILPRPKSKLIKKVVFLMSDENITGHLKELLGILYEDLTALEAQIKKCDSKILKFSKEEEACGRLQTIPGVGEITSVAMVAAVVDPNHFKNGREFSASLGLVPKHMGTGGKTRLGRISKRGDSYLRQLLVHGGRSVLRSAESKQDRLSVWALKIAASRGHNKAAVAVANKNARVIWALMKSGEKYQPRLAA